MIGARDCSPEAEALQHRRRRVHVELASRLRRASSLLGPPPAVARLAPPPDVGLAFERCVGLGRARAGACTSTSVATAIEAICMWRGMERGGSCGVVAPSACMIQGVVSNAMLLCSAVVKWVTWEEATRCLSSNLWGEDEVSNSGGDTPASNLALQWRDCRLNGTPSAPDRLVDIGPGVLAPLTLWMQVAASASYPSAQVRAEFGSV